MAKALSKPLSKSLVRRPVKNEPVNTEDATKKVFITDSLIELKFKGTTRRDWNFMVSCTWDFFIKHSTMPSLEELSEAYGSRPWWPSQAARIYASDEYSEACYYRGIRGEEDGLDDRMLMAIAAISDITSTRSLKTRLSDVGVSSIEHQTWLNYEPYRQRVREVTQKIINGAEDQIMLTLTEGALNGKLEFIKYWDERTGKYNPKVNENIDAEGFVRAVLSIISKHLSHEPELMRTIGGELSLLLGGMGVNPNERRSL